MEGIEGEWNGFTFRVATLEDFDKISNHLRVHFFHDEPLNKLLNWSEAKIEDHDLMMRAVLSHGLSILALHSETYEVVGTRITIDSRKQLDFYSLNVRSPQTLQILNIMSKLDKNGKLTKERYGVEYFADFFISSVHKKFRRKGLATQMYVRNLQYLKLKGFPLVKGFFTSPITRTIAERVGFHEFGRVYLRDETESDGHPSFPSAPPDQFASTMILSI